MTLKTIFLYLLMCGSPIFLLAQGSDTLTRTATDTSTIKMVIDGTIPYLKIYPNPKRAGLFSAMWPAAGQLYNKQYWKLPVIYLGMGVAGYFIIDNTKQYRRFKKAYIQRIDGDPTTVDEFVNIYPSAANLKQGEDFYRKNIDLTVLLTALGYTVQVLDAIAYAYLKDFDVNPDITLRLAPVIHPQGVGIGLVMNFK